MSPRRRDERVAGPGAGKGSSKGDGAGAECDRDDRPSHVRSVEPRILEAWRQWLTALASNADAALAAAHVYAELPPEGREAWLAALIEDGPTVRVPLVAIYGPLLAVETDPDRRRRIVSAIGGEPPCVSIATALALRGVPRGGAARSAELRSDPRGGKLVVLVAPSYLDFVQVLTCRYSPDEGFDWVEHEPIVPRHEVPQPGHRSKDGVVLESTPLKVVVEELAHAILAHRRRGREIHPGLRRFAGLFDACPVPDP